jgi:hypothetical protein
MVCKCRAAGANADAARRPAFSAREARAQRRFTHRPPSVVGRIAAPEVTPPLKISPPAAVAGTISAIGVTFSWQIVLLVQRSARTYPSNGLVDAGRSSKKIVKSSLRISPKRWRGNDLPPSLALRDGIGASGWYQFGAVPGVRSRIWLAGFSEQYYDGFPGRVLRYD